MKYLLINHVPFGRGSAAGTFRVGDMWLEDLRAQARAINDAGMRLVVATPLVDDIKKATSGSFNSIEIVQEEEGFEYRPLPYFITFTQFLRTRGRMRAALEAAMRDVDIVQAGYGGHPIALGQIAWPIARELKKKRIWVFDGGDPFPRLEISHAEEKNPVKKLGKKIHMRYFRRFLRDAVVDADMVFAHNASVPNRFKDIWHDRCHRFDRSFVREANLITEEELRRCQEHLLDASKPLRLVAAGRQIAIKGTDHVLRAMRKAIDRGAKLELEVLGDGEELANYKALAKELNLNGAVRFAGTVPYGKPLFDAWADDHVMVITNLTSELSRNVLLSMARGLPLIMYTNIGTDNLIKTSGAGWLAPRGDIDALADLFIRAVAKRGALAEMAARGLATARTNTLDATHRQRAQLAATLLSTRP